MTQDQKMAAIAQELLIKGIVEKSEIDANVAKMASQCPEATAAEKGLTTDIDKAYEVLMISKGSASPAPTSTSAVTTQPVDTVSAAEKMAINKTLVAQHTDRLAVTNNTSIEQYVFDRPAPSDWIPAGTKGVIDPKVWENIEKKWAAAVVPDTDQVKSRSNYEILKAAAAAGTPVDVYIGSLNTKPIGYIMSVGSNVGAANQTQQMTREQVINFLVLETAGYILSSGVKPGVKLRYIKQKNDPRKPGHVIEAKSVLADANKKAAVEAGSYVISREVTAEKKTVGVKSALSFLVDTGKKKQNGGGAILRTVRVTVKADIPVLSRKPEFVDTFGTGEKVSNANLEYAPEGKAAKNITDAQQHAIAALRAKLGQPDSFAEVSQYADKLKAFDAAPAAGPTPVI
ncbi:MAG: hypothetical protein NC548_28520 [Lachnospiraceae bacterium]|nr:hypothetical protein [Lachnospiraceae bacterium]